MNTNTVKKHNKQIVTVAVITYHSAATVLETLDSIVNQTYGPENIELIISDDGSKDSTVQVIESWLVENLSLFHSVTFFANEANVGISKNCNVAWKAATSEWVKTIAGDDQLVENALDIYMQEVKRKPEAKCFFSLVTKFTKDNEVHIKASKKMKRFFASSVAKQYYYLIIENVIYAPTSFLNRALLHEVDYADETYRLIEDFPLWLKLSRSGNHFHLIELPLVRYRISESVSRSDLRIINPSFANEVNSVMLAEIKNLEQERHYFFARLLGIDTNIRRLYEWFIFNVLGNKSKYLTIAKFISIIKLTSPLAIFRLIGL